MEDVGQRWLSGDETALTDAYHQWGRLVHTVATRSLGDHSEADDVTQQVFVAAWQTREAWDPRRGALHTWLLGITRRKVADAHDARWRRERRQEAAVQQPPPTPPSLEASVVDAVMVGQAVDDLGEPRASVVRLALMEGRPHAEVAELLGLPLGTVKSHARRALIALRDQLTEVAHAW